MYSVVHVSELPNVVANEILELTREDDMFREFDEMLEFDETFAGEYDFDLDYDVVTEFEGDVTVLAADEASADRSNFYAVA